MKRKIKLVLTVLAVCAMSAFGMLASGCNVVDKIKEKINQARCEHEWNEGEITKEATCIEVGEKTKTCLLCNKVETEEIEKVEHVAIVVDAVAPTCTKTGLTSGTKCGVCGEVLIGQQVVSALGHVEVKDTAVSPTCLYQGKTEGSHCSVCGDIFIKQESIPAVGHVVVALDGYAPTCERDGLTSGYSCSVCGEVFEQQTIIPAFGHKMIVTQEEIAVTCTTDGKTKGTVCANCGEVGFVSSTISALGHKFVTDEAIEATCIMNGKTEGSHCSRCNEILVGQVVIPAFGHNVQEVAEIASTCIKPGLKEGHQCVTCGEVFDGEALPLIPHRYSGGKCTMCGAALYSAEYLSSMSVQEIPEGNILTAGYYRYEIGVDTSISIGIEAYSLTGKKYEVTINYLSLIGVFSSQYDKTSMFCGGSFSISKNEGTDIVHAASTNGYTGLVSDSNLEGRCGDYGYLYINESAEFTTSSGEIVILKLVSVGNLEKIVL